MTSGLLLREAIQAKYSMEEAAQALGISRTALYSQTAGEVNDEYIQNVKSKLPRVQFSFNRVEEDQEEYGGDLSMKTIYSLAQSNKQIAESNASLSRSNEELVMMMKATVNVQKQTDLNVSTRFADLLELIAEIGSGKKKWMSKQEAVAELSKRFLVGQLGK
jgi:hypothetical protein